MISGRAGALRFENGTAWLFRPDGARVEVTPRTDSLEDEAAAPAPQPPGASGVASGATAPGATHTPAHADALQ
jgi:hypothetical protein